MIKKSLLIMSAAILCQGALVAEEANSLENEVIATATVDEQPSARTDEALVYSEEATEEQLLDLAECPCKRKGKRDNGVTAEETDEQLSLEEESAVSQEMLVGCPCKKKKNKLHNSELEANGDQLACDCDDAVDEEELLNI